MSNSSSSKPSSTFRPAKTTAIVPAAAYLVLQHGGRWSDVYRLDPNGPTVLGRSSENPIVIRSEGASRRHAEVLFDTESDPVGWRIRDLGSRNGTFVNSVAIPEQSRLCDGDLITVCGFPLRFAESSQSLARIQNLRSPPSDSTSNGDTSDRGATEEIDPASIVDRLGRSDWLHNNQLHGDQLQNHPRRGDRAAENRLPGGRTSGDGAVREQSMRAAVLRLSFKIAAAGDFQTAVQCAIDFLLTHTPATNAGVDPPAETALALKWSGDLRSMPLLGDGAILARNIRSPGDSAPPSPSPHSPVQRNSGSGGQDSGNGRQDSLGQIDAASLILAPIEIADVKNSGSPVWGYVHLRTRPDAPPLDRTDLQSAVAVAEILSVRLSHLESERRLSQTLAQTRQQIRWLEETLADRLAAAGKQLVGRSEPMARVLEQVRMAGPTQSTILIRGESGVGKELIAAAIHGASERADGPLVCLNCAALSPTLLESELFGHERGSFTGATEQKRGKFEAAHRGTLLLDEIGEMTPETQTKFLRVLEERSFQRVGGQATVEVDVRVVAATNRNLQAMVDEGGFRQDLYYRLHVIEILVPPLRERGHDVLLLAQHFIEKIARPLGRPMRTISPAAEAKLLQYQWPGNIRELRNVIERAVVLSTAETLQVDDLLLSPAGGVSARSSEQTVTPEQTLAEIERDHIYRVLRYTDNNKSQAAAILGIERSTLDRKLKRYKSH